VLIVFGIASTVLNAVSAGTGNTTLTLSAAVVTAVGTSLSSAFHEYATHQDSQDSEAMKTKVSLAVTKTVKMHGHEYLKHKANEKTIRDLEKLFVITVNSIAAVLAGISSVLGTSSMGMQMAAAIMNGVSLVVTLFSQCSTLGAPPHRQNARTSANTQLLASEFEAAIIRKKSAPVDKLAMLPETKVVALDDENKASILTDLSELLLLHGSQRAATLDQTEGNLQELLDGYSPAQGIKNIVQLSSATLRSRFLPSHQMGVV